MPQLIVIATLELGGIILTESALSFLGIGLSYPMPRGATWSRL
jgi:peptide/nickel transport system permease protein